MDLSRLLNLGQLVSRKFDFGKFLSFIRTKRPKLGKGFYLAAIGIDLAIILFILALSIEPTHHLISPFVFQQKRVHNAGVASNEVFGFVPYWNIDKLNNVRFDLLTTLAYFDIPVDSNGNIVKSSIGYQTFQSDKAKEVFKKAQGSGSRVVITLTQMDDATIRALMDSPDAQDNLISQATSEVQSNNLDGVNVDFEYTGNVEDSYRSEFSQFVKNLTDAMHRQNPDSKVTVSVYASAVKDPKIYDIKDISGTADGIFMMAYDFATSGSESAMPTDPLYGYKEGQYWYDISTAVDDFLTQMTPGKLILGLPWYGYDYPVSEPAVMASTNQGYYVYYKTGKRWRKYFVKDKSFVQTYSSISTLPALNQSLTGWDDVGKVAWNAYYSIPDKTWRMVFFENANSLSIKYDFAKSKNLGGIGIWALGFEQGTDDLWKTVSQEFGTKVAEN